ncbi:hypothetical protein J132_09582 [Termitomyces sp. J132]|nr:hypothetical protein J132_09582 [Termitomyces sp. J132]
MGWTNSVPIFHDDITFILKDEIPHVTWSYIDDVPVRGPPHRYELPNGGYDIIPENSGIRRFVWEHLQNVNRVLQKIKYVGGTFSGKKSVVCANEIVVVGHSHICMPEGQVPEESCLVLLKCWGPCKLLSEVCAFLGTAGILIVATIANSVFITDLSLCMLNNREACFSQPKLELYSLFKALQALCMYFLRVHNLIIKVDVHSIKGIDAKCKF